MIALNIPDDFEHWREQAKTLLRTNTPPDQVQWGNPSLFGEPLPSVASTDLPLRVPAAFARLAETIFMHSDPAKLHLLYRLLWRVQNTRHLLSDATDRDVALAALYAKAIRRDIHKMRAFVRFRELTNDLGEQHFVAWFEPDHNIVRANAGFFMRRFAAMRWSILTPRLCLHWDGHSLRESQGIAKPATTQDDPIEDLWRSYYASIFNPARLKTNAMLKEMPRRYWKNMPEAQLIPGLIAGAQAREAGMIALSRAPDTPAPTDWLQLREDVNRCTRCPIHCAATQAVHGEGPINARLMIVGEQPGDQEDQLGRPFVGPAGQILRDALHQAGIDPTTCYRTNAVKHFKHQQQGKLRLHQAPNAGEIDHCRWWLDAERQLLRPQLILALGASAVRGLTGRPDSITKLRGQPIALPDGAQMVVTTHPSYVLRVGAAGRQTAMAALIDDLRCVAAMLNSDSNSLAFSTVPA